jgi:hypothetical protein
MGLEVEYAFRTISLVYFGVVFALALAGHIVSRRWLVIPVLVAILSFIGWLAIAICVFVAQNGPWNQIWEVLILPFFMSIYAVVV